MEQNNNDQSWRDAMQDAMRDQQQMMQQMLQTMQAMMARMEVQNRAPPIRREQQRRDVGLPSDQEGAAYFGELEEALMQGVAGIRSDGDRKPFFPTRPPTLEIFPSWPMRFQQTSKGNSQPAESTDSGSAQNTISQLDSESPVSIKASLDQPSKQQQQEQEQQQQQQGMMASDGPSTGAAAAPNHQPKTQENRRVTGPTAEKGGKILDAKTLRRLAQNREAARKSRLRKKAYVQQLEVSRIKLTQLEQDLQRARSQGLFLGGASAGGNISSAAAVFDMEYARWLEEDYKHMADLRGGLQAHLPDGDLRVIVDECLVHYDEIFRLKGAAAKSDVFHLITGMWTTSAERCFLWMGGFRPSELLKILIPQLDPLTEQQLVGICNLQQSSQQAEEALSQGLEQLHQSLADTVASGSLSEGSNVVNYMGQMAIALGKLANLEGFVREASEDSSLRSSFSEAGENDEDISSDQSSGRVNRSATVSDGQLLCRIGPKLGWSQGNGLLIQSHYLW